MTERMLASTTVTTYDYVYDGGQLRQMTITTTVTADEETTTQTDTLEFTYDAAGAPQTLTCGNTTYLYVTNLQGDVVAILDAAGNTVVQYSYDAWGKILDTTGSMVDTFGVHNPLRYRGYVYDTETELYYLQSRYYNPAIGRFINADSYTSTGQGLLGNNMFAYCGNNPISRADFAGHAFVQMVYDDGNHLSLLCPALGGGGGGGGGSYALAGFSAAKDGIRKLKDFLTNESEEVVLKSNGISFYKGAMVIRANIGQYGGGASYGIIILDDSFTYDEYGIKTLNHEYGHFRHMKQIGIKSYTVTTAIPSLIGAALSDPEGTGIQQFIAKNYYSQPWERIAEQLGGLNRGYFLVQISSAPCIGCIHLL